MKIEIRSESSPDLDAFLDERLGYARLGAVADYPKGHAKLLYVKQLRSDAGT